MLFLFLPNHEDGPLDTCRVCSFAGASVDTVSLYTAVVLSKDDEYVGGGRSRNGKYVFGLGLLLYVEFGAWCIVTGAVEYINGVPCCCNDAYMAGGSIVVVESILLQWSDFNTGSILKERGFTRAETNNAQN